VGVALGPIGTKWINPVDYSSGKNSELDSINLDLTRLVLGIQLFITGVQLPQRYLKTEWKSLAVLLGPNMILMWLITSVIIYFMIPAVPFLYALAIGACVTPTDPVLSNTIVKGDFAEKNISEDLRHVIEGESGANDGLGYLFLFLPLLLIEHTGTFAGDHQGIGTALKTFLLETVLYQVILSCVIGIALGWISMKVVRFMTEHNWVDHNSFTVLSVAIAVGIDALE
jgi:NhaP-type Na+/H+ or K+/H+ antiporter